ncbi:MAG: hypothetical protein MJA30_38015 [Cytophagales bacterium]|nr:hypothetical protein [Cytophagales bacterium]
MSRSVLFLLSIFVVLSCSTGFEDAANAFFVEVQQANPGFDVPFVPGSLPSEQKLKLDAQLYGASSSGQVQVDLVIRHALSTPLVLNATDFTLHTPDGNFSHPVPVDTGLSIPPKMNYSFSLLFKPVHDRRFFMHTGMRGDLNQQYTLQVKLPQEKYEYHFKMADSTWLDYRQNHAAQDQVVLFKPTLDKKAQKEYQVASGRPSFVHWDENEIAMAGINLQLRSYHWLDTLYLDLRLVNHSTEALYVHPGELQYVQDFENELKKEKNGPHVIRRSQRWIKEYRSYHPVPPDSLILRKKFITKDSLGREALFAKDVVFIR